MARPSSRWRRVRRWLLTCCVVTIVAVVAGIPVYVRPQLDELRHADAILVLGGPDYSRNNVGVELYSQGWAPMLVISNPNGPGDAWMTEFCATPTPGLNLHCFIPNPVTTIGEGRELRRLADQYGWRTVIVVTYRPHVSRARYILDKCFDGELIMRTGTATMSPAQWAYQYVYQTAGFVRAALQGC